MAEANKVLIVDRSCEPVPGSFPRPVDIDAMDRRSGTNAAEEV